MRIDWHSAPGDAWGASWQAHFNSGTIGFQRFFNGPNRVVLAGTPIIGFEQSTLKAEANVLPIGNYEIIREAVFSRDSNFTDIVVANKNSTYNDGIIYEFDTMINIIELYVKPPVVARPTQADMISSVNLMYGEGISRRGDEWLSISDVISVEDAEMLMVTVRFNALNDTETFPRNGQLKVANETIDAMTSVAYFDYDGRFVQGELIFQVPLDVYRAVSRGTTSAMEIRITEVMTLETLYDINISDR
ncbi:MAG: hypothetical protein FWE24_09360 [Defluviitaleaceae bacterium]|nr:hypothetical protein [Defluviitaleaceae bacterium]